ncbi:MAG: flagellar biosynthesis protein FlhA [Bordetella sp. SCN 67-23]|nr:FHIPEP family type III secretion protein [Burkholderiales bacterium]ODS72337.1 MAG: flagellar biosynthesis protein FlhA [Bordetella sp. SCN 67-23]OJW86883.1 MAG: flagellar biosynthesis protein FlhA [Burkholderiales bacterium 67-32]
MNALRDILGKNADLALVFGVVAILLILFTPIPATLLDLLIIVNVAFALTILLLTFYVLRPVEFSTFPSLLLIATLFRLSLNIAATRLILSDANAGEVIGAIGAFVVQGNFLIGLIVFFILVVVQYVVVTNGAQRVSEVSARFVLDAMPGQQMSIDADLNMGLIDQDEARRRRTELEREAAFYGSMDGASKFVKGDAIAGIIILLINIAGGWLIGVAQMNMSWSQALKTFTLLTIGDGIVTQVPALIISVATGIIVTRSSADRQLSSEVLRQLVSFPKIQLLVMLALVGLLSLPGMPKWPILILIAGAALTWTVLRFSRRTAPADSAEPPSEAASETAASPPVPAIELVFGDVLAQAMMPLESQLTERTATLRTQLAADHGLTLPPIVFRSGTMAAANEYVILLHGNRFGHATLHADRTLAIHASDQGDGLQGIKARDPAFGLPAIWITSADVARARQRGFTTVDPATVMITHLGEVLKNHLAHLLPRSEVVRLLEGVRERQPGLLEELIPSVLATSDVQRILQNLLAEHVSIRNIDLIGEILVDAGRHQKDPLLLTEIVRQRLSHTICEPLLDRQNTLSVLTLESKLESVISQNIRASDGSGSYVLDPKTAEAFLVKLIGHAEAMMRQSLTPVLLCNPEIRRQLKSFSRRAVPRLAVLSVAEIPPSVDLKAFATVAVN